MNHLKHSLFNISKLITNEIIKGNVVCQEYIHNKLDTDNYIRSTIYEKEDVGVYIADEWNNGLFSGYPYLYAKGIPTEDLHTIEKAVKQMLSVRR